VLYKAMEIRLVIAAGTFSTLLSPLAIADDGVPTTNLRRIGVQAQLEVLTQGSATYVQGEPPLTVDFATAYAISGVLDYAFTPYLRIGLAPRLILHVKDDGYPTNPVNKALDVRARVRAQYSISAFELYAAVTPGYEIILVDAPSYDGLALGGSLGVTYDLSPSTFVGSEIGYQVAFTDRGDSDTWKLSYMHIGLAAGRRF
jgi:hypothetical protein